MPLPPLQLRNVKRLGKQFTFGRQEDSHELYVRLVEAIEAVQVTAGGQPPGPSKGQHMRLVAMGS